MNMRWIDGWKIAFEASGAKVGLLTSHTLRQFPRVFMIGWNAAS